MVFDFSFSGEDPELPAEEDKEETGTQIRSYIGPDVTLKGQLIMRQGMEIAGAFEGNLTSFSTVKILAQGKVEGAVEAVNVAIEGTSISQMNARKRLEIFKHGRFIGALITQPEILVLSEFSTFGQNEEIAQTFRKEYTRERAAKASKNGVPPATG